MAARKKAKKAMVGRNAGVLKKKKKKKTVLGEGDQKITGAYRHLPPTESKGK